MKKIIIALLLIFPAKLILADSWTELTLAQAEKAVAHIKANPYIFDYCDCCDQPRMNMIFVKEVYYKETGINAYEVFVKGEIIHVFNYVVADDEIAILDEFMTVKDVQEEEEIDPNFEGVISVNYTFVFFKVTEGEKNATRLMDITGYDQEISGCVPFVQFPYPDSKQKVNPGYAKWYNGRK